MSRALSIGAARDMSSLGQRAAAAFVDVVSARHLVRNELLRRHPRREESRQRGSVRPNTSTSWIPLSTPLSVVGEGRSPWRIIIDDGRVVPLDVTVLLGRNPQRRAGDPVSQLVPASGDGRTVDRTHVMIGTDARGVWVVDRDSTTGTAVLLPDGSFEELPPERKRHVDDGQRVAFGERWFDVRRTDER